ncbi:MAG TPA: antibiotic biosynthesis monooxygenase [Thermodesulfobacteriota bacterium]|nr:antibiotic biosynthesis monooxygenase [Thermodesulfobacteriota bacterium]
MIKMVFMYEVVKEKQDEYLSITRDRIKPFWESHACESYTLWQAPEEPTSFIKEMVFKDEATMQTVMSLEDAQPVKKLFSQFANNVTRKTYRQAV